jgi:hypothetical protein
MSSFYLELSLSHLFFFDYKALAEEKKKKRDSGWLDPFLLKAT